MAGYLVIFGLVAENQPWGCGWVHDLKWFIKKSYNNNSHLEENSPERMKLQRKIDAWYPQAIERYPQFKVNHKEVPDMQNGFLKKNFGMAGGSCPG
jgi:hypothetical protein